MIGGPLGAIAGGAIGHHLFDKDDGQGAAEWRRRMEEGSAWGGSSGTGAGAAEQRQMSYFLALFSIMGKLAKADGHITQEEGQQVVSFLDRMGVRGEQRQFAIQVFNEAKNSRYSAEDFARQFAELSRTRHDLRASMVDMLFQIALADGEFHSAEEAMISSIAGILGISAQELKALRERYVGNSDQAYAALGLDADADDDEVKSAYRQLVQEYHPDRIVSKGMPEEFVEYATKRFQEIQDAWETIKKERAL